MSGTSSAVCAVSALVKRRHWRNPSQSQLAGPFSASAAETRTGQSHASNRTKPIIIRDLRLRCKHVVGTHANALRVYNTRLYDYELCACVCLFVRHACTCTCVCAMPVRAHTAHTIRRAAHARALVPRPPSLPASHIIAQLHSKRNGLSHAWIACWPAMQRKRVSARYRDVGIFRDVFTYQKPSTLSFSKRTRDGTPLKPTHHTQRTHARC